MQGQATSANGAPPTIEAIEMRAGHARRARGERILQSALRKRALGVPTYTVPEAAALLSRSQEYLYRQIKADAFPAIDMAPRRRGHRGDYTVPAKAVEAMLDAATTSGGVVYAAEFGAPGGAA